MPRSTFPTSSEVRSWDQHQLSEYILQHGTANSTPHKLAEFFRQFNVGGDAFMSLSEGNLAKLTKDYPRFLNTLLRLQGKDPHHSPRIGHPRIVAVSPDGSVEFRGAQCASLINTPDGHNGVPLVVESFNERDDHDQDDPPDRFDYNDNDNLSLSSSSQPDSLTTLPAESAHTDYHDSDPDIDGQEESGYYSIYPTFTPVQGAVPDPQLPHQDYFISVPILIPGAPLLESIMMPGAYSDEHEDTRLPHIDTPDATPTTMLFATPSPPCSRSGDAQAEDFTGAMQTASRGAVGTDGELRQSKTFQALNIDEDGEVDNVDNHKAEVALASLPDEELQPTSHVSGSPPDGGSQNGPARAPVTQPDIEQSICPDIDPKPHTDLHDGMQEINHASTQSHDGGTDTDIPQSNPSSACTHDQTQTEFDQDQMRSHGDRASSGIDGSPCSGREQPGEGTTAEMNRERTWSDRGLSDLPGGSPVNVLSSGLWSPRTIHWHDGDDPLQSSVETDRSQSDINGSFHDEGSLLDDISDLAPTNQHNDNVATPDASDDRLPQYKPPLRITPLTIEPFSSFADSDEISPLILRDGDVHNHTTHSRSPSLADYGRSPGRVSIISPTGRTLFPSGRDDPHFRSWSAYGKEKAENIDSGFIDLISLPEVVKPRTVEVGIQTDPDRTDVKKLRHRIRQLERQQVQLQTRVKKLGAAREKQRKSFLSSLFSWSSPSPTSRSQTPTQSRISMIEPNILAVQLQ